MREAVGESFLIEGERKRAAARYDPIGEGDLPPTARYKDLIHGR